MKSIFITDLSLGDSVDELFVIRKVELKEYPNGKMIAVELGDKSGRLKGVIWSGSSELLKSLQPAKVYRVRGTVTSYKGDIQITVEKAEVAAEFDPSDFLARGSKSFDELDSILADSIGSIDDNDYKQLLNKIFSDGSLRRDFLNGIGGKLWHHNYIGGLAEHTFSVFNICRDLSGRFQELDRNLLLTGALLHDIGKSGSYSMEAFFDYTDSGRLLGHIVMGDEIATKAIGELAGFPPEKSLKIRHLILSHQGSPEQSSPVPPMMPEGTALYCADLLDSQLAALRRIKQKEHRQGIRWSNYVNLLDRHIYFGDEESI